jgi:Lon protease-like protein
VASRLPLFPLRLVLFPAVHVPLHIVEPRYRRMLADCLASDHEFGILYRPEGVAERDIPSGHVGCVAHVERSELLPDGRSNILVTGVRRFALEQFEDTDLPYYVGRVVDVVDVAESAPTLTVLAARVRELFLRVGAAARSLADDADALPELPDDPAMLAFAIAAVIEMDVSTRQRLLASRSPTSRLREVEMLLAPAVDSLEHRAVIHVRAKTNGHGPQPQSPG